jgi:HK97 gp10 family phage protein
MNARYQLSGFRELDAALRQLPEKVARRAVVNGLRASGAVFSRALKRAAPVRARGSKPKRLGKSKTIMQPRGFLRRTVGASKPFADRSGKLSIRLSGRRAFYGKFLEFGTRRMGPRPFFRSAIEGAAMAAFDRLRDVIARGIERAARES